MAARNQTPTIVIFTRYPRFFLEIIHTSLESLHTSKTNLLIPATSVKDVDDGGYVPRLEEIEYFRAVLEEALYDLEDAVSVVRQGELSHELTQPAFGGKSPAVSMVTMNHCSYVYYVNHDNNIPEI